MEGFDHLHVEATEEAAQDEQQNDSHHHHFGDVVPAALFYAFTDQNTQHQTRYGVTHDQLRCAAKHGCPEARFFARINGRQPENYRHYGIDQQVGCRNQHLHSSNLKGCRNGRGGEVKEGDHEHADDTAGNRHFARVVQGFTDVAVFQHQRRRTPVRDDAMVNVLSECPRSH
ncbi:hypothetical protein D3C75_165700 [compost metagenome]